MITAAVEEREDYLNVSHGLKSWLLTKDHKRIGLLYLAIGVPLCLVLIGIPVLAWWLLWSSIRIIKGITSVNEYKPIANPRSWLFG